MSQFKYQGTQEDQILLELINYITSEFIELHGDRNFCDDKAIVGGLAKIDEQSVVILVIKGRTTTKR